MLRLRPILDHWRFCALLAAVAMLAIAHGFERWGGYPPCALCLRQREVYWVAAAIGAIGMVLVRRPGGPRLREASCWLLMLVFLGGGAIAAYHAGAESRLWPGPATCSSRPATVGVEAMNAFLEGGRIRPASCDQAPWVFAGLSMAGWNALISLGLAALSFAAAGRERTKR